MTKVISISDDAYELLKRFKMNKSFSEVIIEIVGDKSKNSLMEFAGILTDKEANEMKKNIRETRKLSSGRFK